MSVPRLPVNLVTIRQVEAPRFQIAGIAYRPEKHFRKGFAHVDFSNYRTVVTHGNNTLLYVGISPKAPPKNGAAPSKQKLFDRIRYHYRGNAEGSTLRLTLGCLLSERLGIQLRRVGSGTRMTFADGESALSRWMEKNAFVVWVVDSEPWLLEEKIIGELSLPLNLDMNSGHPFHKSLSQIRKAAKEAARARPVIS